MATKQRGLGKGLSQLIGASPVESAEWQNYGNEVSVDRLSPNPFQPRRAFDQVKLEELAESIRQHGVLQPIVVRPSGDGYQIIAGERRWRAAQLAGLSVIPAVVKELTDSEMIQIALIENIQREGLNPIEEALAYRRLMDEFRMTQEALSVAVGRSRPVIANAVRLLTLPAEVQELVSRETISEGHARCLLALKKSELQVRIAKHIADKGLTVRQTEELVKRLIQDVSRETTGKRSSAPDPDSAALAEKIGERLGTRVKISGSGRKGKLEIEYYTAEDLDRILEIIMGTV